MFTTQQSLTLLPGLDFKIRAGCIKRLSTLKARRKACALTHLAYHFHLCFSSINTVCLRRPCTFHCLCCSNVSALRTFTKVPPSCQLWVLHFLFPSLFFLFCFGEIIFELHAPDPFWLLITSLMFFFFMQESHLVKVYHQVMFACFS